ncbi:MAG: hypothetical protein IPM94_12240 [bacterium]|nr:hypothetical protein [bacterium]
MLHDMIAKHAGFYRCPVDASCRSKMNVVWRLPSEELGGQFIKRPRRPG